MTSSIEGCLDACRRCEAVVDHSGPAWRVLAPHLRHCVEHFQLLLEGVASGRVDYDARERNARLEGSPESMRQALRVIRGALVRLSEQDLARPLAVVQTAASGRPPRSVPSFLERELVFLSGHAIHHIAIMALAAASAGVFLPPELAVAFSTEAYRDSTVLQ
jgi:hypothetical protein